MPEAQWQCCPELTCLPLRGSAGLAWNHASPASRFNLPAVAAGHLEVRAVYGIAGSPVASRLLDCLCCALRMVPRSRGAVADVRPFSAVPALPVRNARMILDLVRHAGNGRDEFLDGRSDPPQLARLPQELVDAYAAQPWGG